MATETVETKKTLSGIQTGMNSEPIQKPAMSQDELEKRYKEKMAAIPLRPVEGAKEMINKLIPNMLLTTADSEAEIFNNLFTKKYEDCTRKEKLKFKNLLMDIWFV